jgi:RNA polymerase sigma factor (sigma-70 family)
MRSGSGELEEQGDEPPAAATASVARGERLVLELLGAHADALLRTARRYSLCVDDAHDAYQRGLEILIRHAARLDPDRAPAWLHVVVKHEALAVNRSRRRLLGASELDLDALEARTTASPEERALASDRVARSAEALHGLKPQELRALWLKALGHSYAQIAEATGWSYTKVNRCLTEGRRSFLERYAGIEAGEECERLAPVLSAFVDGEASAAQAGELRSHLRGCLACRATVRGLHDASRPLAVVFPVAGLAMAGAGVEQASAFFMRVYETVTLQFHERAANSILRAQAIVDTASVGKMAAVAASAAAVAGGGIAVEGTVKSSSAPRAAAANRAKPAVRAPSFRRAKPPRTIWSRPHPEPQRSRPSSAATATTTSTTTTTTTNVPQPRPAPVSASTSSGGSAATEFGFEGP